jgi:class 3 adenylate cyclase
MTELLQVLVVDDDDVDRMAVRRQLDRSDLETNIQEATDVASGIEALRGGSFDCAIVDYHLPDGSGLDILRSSQEIVNSPPIVILTGSGSETIAVELMKAGAVDYLPKSELTPSRISQSTRNAIRVRQAEIEAERAAGRLQAEQQKTEDLLLSILPAPIAERLKQGEQTIAESFDEATILFADVFDFARCTCDLSPVEQVRQLNEVFSTFDRLADEHGLEKIKTIGDTYMVAGGIPVPRDDHAEAVAEMALHMQEEALRIDEGRAEPFSLRIGISTGPVVAGVIGAKKFSFDLWGQTVDTANAMKSSGLPGCIQVSEETWSRLKETYLFETRGTYYIEGAGEVSTYLLKARIV